ncbi:hypothetical protein DICPUDRAFT_83633 [Dictyostelium purpureum]|uniref:Uncharacterized protein n=1 Tax=Dictyostelium purpureum TaxID=5786 RepID=F1A048_DICPU|nr:uncharacterized protein DICPUDRAFT_83633 [Dictyostelium purpureum]EGC30442.1 hypothetical protein DICPUDRAFT_83633 [Dictyostelium purpureum]|eukprot:XP_003293042.1 hypothetical protein DICPUDRAFT_83633 [Dictyostelium purpureum]
MSTNNWEVKPTKTQNNNYKVVLIGDRNVGKSTFIYNFNDQGKEIIISGKRNKNTKKIKIIKKNKQKLKLEISKYEEKSLGGVDKSYFMSTNCFFLMFDVTDEDSLLSCKIWLRDIIKFSRPNTPIILLGNKIDLADEKIIEPYQANEFLYNVRDQLKIKQEIPYYEFSSIAPNEKYYNKIFKKSYQLINERFNSSPPPSPNKSLSSSPNSKTTTTTATGTRNSNEDDQNSSLFSKRGSILISKLTNLLKKE